MEHAMLLARDTPYAVFKPAHDVPVPFFIDHRKITRLKPPPSLVLVKPIGLDSTPIPLNKHVSPGVQLALPAALDDFAALVHNPRPKPG
jgi:hypothetical protein